MPKKLPSSFCHALAYLPEKYERNRIFDPCWVIFHIYGQGLLKGCKGCWKKPNKNRQQICIMLATIFQSFPRKLSYLNCYEGLFVCSHLYLRLMGVKYNKYIKVAWNSFLYFPRLRFCQVIITTLYRLMPKSWYIVSKNCPIIGEHVAVNVLAQ